MDKFSWCLVTFPLIFRKARALNLNWCYCMMFLLSPYFFLVKNCIFPIPLLLIISYNSHWSIWCILYCVVLALCMTCCTSSLCHYWSCWLAHHQQQLCSSPCHQSLSLCVCHLFLGVFLFFCRTNDAVQRQDAASSLSAGQLCCSCRSWSFVRAVRTPDAVWCSSGGQRPSASRPGHVFSAMAEQSNVKSSFCRQSVCAHAASKVDVVPLSSGFVPLDMRSTELS